MPKFQQIMNHLDPKVVIAKTEIPHDTARGKYVLKSSVVSSYLEFEKVIIDYTAMHMKETMGSSLPPEFCLDKAKHFLDRSPGFDNSVFIGMSGTDGGMQLILNKICEGFKEEAKRAYFTYIVDTFIDPLAFQDIVQVMRELKAKIGAYSPQSWNYIEPEAMASHYREILWSYIDSLTKYKNLWAY